MYANVIQALRHPTRNRLVPLPDNHHQYFCISMSDDVSFVCQQCKQVN